MPPRKQTPLWDRDSNRLHTAILLALWKQLATAHNSSERMVKEQSARGEDQRRPDETEEAQHTGGCVEKRNRKNVGSHFPAVRGDLAKVGEHETLASARDQDEVAPNRLRSSPQP